MTLIRGIEISTKYAGHGVHLLAYLPDPTHPDLVEELERVLDGRNDRLPATLDRLRALGIDIEADDVRRLAGDAAALGRPHVADALVEAGVVRDRDQAFADYLGPNGPAYVDRYAADLVTMLGTVAAAGGVSVIAHPWASRYEHTALDEAGLAALQEHGLAGIEVDHEDHDRGGPGRAARDRPQPRARRDRVQRLPRHWARPATTWPATPPSPTSSTGSSSSPPRTRHVSAAPRTGGRGRLRGCRAR